MESIAEKVLGIVEDLNNDIEERGGLNYYTPFKFESIGWQGSAVYFMGVAIWSEQNDERNYICGTDEKEPFREFFIKKAEKILKDLNMKMGAF